MSSGIARRTLKNLDFIKKNACRADVHPVTQVVNSLLSLLVFPVAKDKALFASFEKKLRFEDPSDPSGVCAALIQELSVPSLQVAKVGRCKGLGSFFRRLRNAVSHKNLEFSGTDPDSRTLAAVMVTLRDCPYPKGKPGPVDWEITLTAEDLEKLSRYVADDVIRQGL
ncbi:MAG: HEPN family nuclease [Bryobacteraceae bacterium]